MDFILQCLKGYLSDLAMARLSTNHGQENTWESFGMPEFIHILWASQAENGRKDDTGQRKPIPTTTATRKKRASDDSFFLSMTKKMPEIGESRCLFLWIIWTYTITSYIYCSSTNLMEALSCFVSDFSHAWPRAAGSFQWALTKVHGFPALPHGPPLAPWRCPSIRAHRIHGIFRSFYGQMLVFMFHTWIVWDLSWEVHNVKKRSL